MNSFVGRYRNDIFRIGEMPPSLVLSQQSVSLCLPPPSHLGRVFHNNKARPNPEARTSELYTGYTILRFGGPRKNLVPVVKHTVVCCLYVP